jgi:hypothetical protein
MLGLFDMLGGGQSQADDYAQQPRGLGGMSNSLVGLGMGLLQPYNPWAGTNAWTNALQGYQAGSALDQRTAQQQQQMAMERARLQLARETANREPEAIRQLRAAGVPQEKWADYLYPKEGADWSLVEAGVDEWNNPIKVWANKRGDVRPFNMPPSGATAAPQPPATTGAGGVPFTGSGPMGTGAAPPAATPTQRTLVGPSNPPLVTLPDGRVVPIAPGQDPKTVRQHVSAATADVLSGKMNEEQSKSSQFASRMEGAEAYLGNDIDKQGLDTRQAAISNYAPSIVGNRLLTPEYQRFNTAKSQFITGLLRRESGAAISPYEWDRYGKEYFPAPGDSEQVVEQKRKARQREIANMKRSAGPGYKSPDLTVPPVAGNTAAPAPPAGGRTGGAAVPSAPPRPTNVPQGSAYSPSLNQWRDPSGKLYDATGRPL